MKETGYEGEGSLPEQWWRQTAAERQMNTTLKEIWKQRGSDVNRNLEGGVRAREERKSRSLVVTGEGREGDGVLLVFLDGDRQRRGGRMTP